MNPMVEAMGAFGGEADGVDFVACNTDLQALGEIARCERHPPRRGEHARGLGAGGIPAMGAQALEEARPTRCENMSPAATWSL